MPPKSCFQGNLVFTNSIATSRLCMPLPAPVGVQAGGAREARAQGEVHAPGGGGGCAVWELLLVPCTLKVLEVGIEFELCAVSEHMPLELVALDADSGLGFTCFTGTKVQILKQLRRGGRTLRADGCARHEAGADASDTDTRFTCLTCTKVQILTRKTCTQRRRVCWSRRGGHR